MAQTIDSATGTGGLVDDYDAICRTIQLLDEGAATGDTAKLQEAFSEDARLYGSLAGERLDVPIAEYIALAAKAPVQTGNFRARVLSVQQMGDAAMAIAASEGSWGSVSFYDYLLLSRIDGTWKIVSKLFAHTGGEPPDFGE
jgi:hypothetical protein